MFSFQSQIKLHEGEVRLLCPQCVNMERFTKEGYPCSEANFEAWAASSKVRVHVCPEETHSKDNTWNAKFGTCMYEATPPAPLLASEIKNKILH